MLIFTAAMASVSLSPEHQHLNYDEEPSTDNTILCITFTSAMSIFCAIIFRLIWLKYKSVVLIFSVQQNRRGAKAATLPSFIYN